MYLKVESMKAQLIRGFESIGCWVEAILAIEIQQLSNNKT